MTIELKTKRCTELSVSDFEILANSTLLNEDVGKCSGENAGVYGDSLFFAPLPGFYFICCGPLTIDTPFNGLFHCDEPVFSTALVLAGNCEYSIPQKKTPSLPLEKNMFFVGYWDNVVIKTHFPIQKSYHHLGFFFKKSALESFFGLKTAQQLIKTIRQKQNSIDTVSGFVQPNVFSRMEQVATNVERNSVVDLLTLRAIALNCFSTLINSMHILESNLTYSPHQEDIQKIAKLKKHIEDNFLALHNAKNVCLQFGMSFSKANSLFKTLYSSTIAQYIHRQKMAYAYARLVSRECNVTECALEIGYSNISHFITSFKKCYNLTPKAATRVYKDTFHFDHTTVFDTPGAHILTPEE